MAPSLLPPLVVIVSVGYKKDEVQTIVCYNAKVKFFFIPPKHLHGSFSAGADSAYTRQNEIIGLF